MEPEQSTEVFLSEKQPSVWNTVTPFSKYLAMTLFVILPFVGGWLGYTLAPDKVVEVEKVVMIDSVDETQEQVEIITPTESSNDRRTVTAIENAQNPEANLDIEKVFGVDDWVTEIDRKPFSFQGVPGAVVHKCIASQVFKDTHGGSSNRCFGTNVISLEWNDEEIIVDSLNTPDIESLFSIQSIFFNEGSWERTFSGSIGKFISSISTSSNRTSAKLIVSKDLLNCLGALPDMCWGGNELSYVVSLPEMESTKLDIQIPDDGADSWGGGLSMYNTEWMQWNEAGSKALLYPPAPAGCPGSVFDVLDLESQTIEMYRIEPLDGCFPPPAEWLDNDTFQAGSSTVDTLD